MFVTHFKSVQNSPREKRKKVAMKMIILSIFFLHSSIHYILERGMEINLYNYTLINVVKIKSFKICNIAKHFLISHG